MKFFDEARIEVAAGDGNGAATFRRENTSRWRPGRRRRRQGRRRCLHAVATATSTPDRLPLTSGTFHAERGENGRGADCYGKGGDDIELRMPVGTIITAQETGESIADLDQGRQARDHRPRRRGGLGNLHFKTSTSRAPRKRTPGGAGERKSQPRTEGAGRCRPAGACPTPQVHLHPRRVVRQAKVADYPSPRSPPTWAWCAPRKPQLRDRRHPGLD